jgi:WhiB family redox-sensing transcriptional regulator
MLNVSGKIKKGISMENIIISSFAISATSMEPAPDWQDSANCQGVDPDLFYPERGASTREAKEVCRTCEVQPDCLEASLQRTEKFGIWGGLSERERRRVRRQRAQVARSTIGAIMTGQEELMGFDTESRAPIETEL